MSEINEKNRNTRFIVCEITAMSEDEYDKLDLNAHAYQQEEDIVKSYQYKLLNSIVDLAEIDVDVVILEYVHRNLKGCQAERSKIWIIDFTRAFKKLKEEQLNDDISN